MEKKLSTTLDSLCKGFPEEFITYMTYCRNLRYGCALGFLLPSASSDVAVSLICEGRAFKAEKERWLLFFRPALSCLVALHGAV